MFNVNEKNMGNAEKSSLAQRILSTVGTIEYLGAPPDLSVKLLSKVKDEKSSIEDIAQIVLCSPPMSALLLKLCNSAYYGRGAVIDSVSRAIVHLGLATVIRFVYAMEMMGMFHGGKDIQGFNESAFWKCGLSGALLAQEIALIQGIDDAEPVFLAGLLRDIGVLVLRQYFPDLFSQAWSLAGRERIGFDWACIAACGLDHRAIAFLLAMRWKLPDAVIAGFQPPARGNDRFEEAMLARNIVRFSEYLLIVRRTFVWDEHAQPDFALGASLYIDAAVIDALLARIVLEVNELFEALKGNAPRRHSHGDR